MSKVEKALQKARAMEGGQAVAAPLQSAEVQAGHELVQAPAPELRVIPLPSQAMAEPWRLSEADLAELRIIYPEMSDHRVVDAFRGIRTKVLQQAGGKNCVILVTSLAGGGGASFIALNLGVSFTFDEGKTALVVDCNLRDPSLEHLVSSDMHYGLTDYLESESIDERQIIHPVGVPRLRLIPAGRKSEVPTEQLGSQKMKSLITELRQRYPDRYIVLDAAPIDTAADAHVLAEIADFILLVVPYGKVTEPQLWSLSRSMGEEKILGVVFNDEPQLPALAWT